MDDKTKEIVDRFETYRSIQQTWAEEIAEDRQFVNNDQWKVDVVTALEANNQPITVNNEMKPARDQVIQQITDNSPRWMAIGRENSDVSIASSFSDLGSYIWDSSNGNMHFLKATEDLEDTGIFIMHPYVMRQGEMGDPEIKVCRLNPSDVYLDPGCTWRNAQDSDRIFISNILSEHKIRALYPDFDFKNAQEYYVSPATGRNQTRDGRKYVPDFLPNVKYYRVIDQYKKIKVPKFKVFDPLSDFEKILSNEEYIKYAQQPAVILTKIGDEKVIIKEDEIEQLFAMISQYGNEFHYMTDGSIRSGLEDQGAVVTEQGINYPIQNSTVRLSVVPIYSLLEEGRISWEEILVDRVQRSLVIGEKIYDESIMPVTRYPFGITMLHHTDTPYPYGDARLAKSIQEQINKTHSLIIAYHINLTNVKYFVPEGTDVNKLQKEGGKAGSNYFTYDPETGGVPVVIQLTAMSNALYEHIDRLKFLIQRIYGTYEFQDGAVSTPPQTKGGTLAIQEAGLGRSRAKLKLVEMALNDLGYVISEMIPHVYTKRKLIRILTPNNKTKDVIFNEPTQDGNIVKIINDLSINRFDLIIVSGSTLPSNRAQRLELKMRAWETGLIRDNATILRDFELPDLEEVLENESKLKEAEQIIQQMDSTIKEMQGDAQTMERELSHKERQIIAEKFKTKLNSISTKLEGSQLLTKYRLADLEKSKKDEIKKKKQKV